MPESRGGHVPSEAEMGTHPEKEGTSEEPIVEAPESEGHKVAPAPHREVADYSLAELAAEVGAWLERMKAQAEQDRLEAVLNALLEKLDPKEKEALGRSVERVFSRLKEEGYPLAAIFQALTKSLQLILGAAKKE